MLQLWPSGNQGPAGNQDPEASELTDDELARTYAYPDRLPAPHLRMNFVSSVDGAVTVAGVSGGLSSSADRRVFGLLRELSEVILVGSGTARAEKYGGARRPSRATGLPPRIAVVTSRAELDPAGPLFTDTALAPLVLTSPAAPAANVDRLTSAGAEVVTRGTAPADLLAALDERGLRRVLCEGGPTLFGELIAADVVDELCLTITPLLVGGDAGRIARATRSATNRMRLAGALTDRDVLLLRYLRDR